MMNSLDDADDADGRRATVVCMCEPVPYQTGVPAAFLQARSAQRFVVDVPVPPGRPCCMEDADAEQATARAVGGSGVFAFETPGHQSATRCRLFQRWLDDVPGNIATAESKWPTLMDKLPRDL